MKLEIKHLVGYLPYGLKAKMNVFGDNQTDVGIEGISVIGEVELSGIRSTVNEFFDISEIKPILHPISDLTKEIEVNREKFVPIQEYHYLRFQEISNYNGGSRTLDFIQVREQNILLKLHFDIHGLIEKGLAIDINTLNKQP